MLQFDEGEWVYVTGRGNIFVTKMPESFPGNLTYRDVQIQGKTYWVIGVEMQAKNDTTLHKGRPVGILVQGPIKK